MTHPHDTDDEFNWTGRDYFEVDLPTLLSMPVPTMHAAPPAAKPVAQTAAVKIEEIDDPDATRLYTPRPNPIPQPKP